MNPIIPTHLTQGNLYECNKSIECFSHASYQPHFQKFLSKHISHFHKFKDKLPGKHIQPGFNPF